jgi:hypothetical protein
MGAVRHLSEAESAKGNADRIFAADLREVHRLGRQPRLAALASDDRRQDHAFGHTTRMFGEQPPGVLPAAGADLQAAISHTELRAITDAQLALRRARHGTRRPLPSSAR